MTEEQELIPYRKRRKTGLKTIYRKMGCPEGWSFCFRRGARSVLVCTKTPAPHPLSADSGDFFHPPPGGFKKLRGNDYGGGK